MTTCSQSRITSLTVIDFDIATGADSTGDLTDLDITCSLCKELLPQKKKRSCVKFHLPQAIYLMDNATDAKWKSRIRPCL